MTIRSQNRLQPHLLRTLYKELTGRLILVRDHAVEDGVLDRLFQHADRLGGSQAKRLHDLLAGYRGLEVTDTVFFLYIGQLLAHLTEVVQEVGQWQRSDPHWQDAMQFVHSGQLGKIRTVRVFSYQGWCPSIPVKPDEAVPAGVDYDMWLGPAPKRPFNRNRFHFTFRWFWDYAGGLMTDWGVHLLDYALYGMNVTAPESIMASGGKFGYPDDACETPDLLQTIYTFKDFTVMWDHAIGIDDGAYGRNHGLGFVGENGTLVIDRGGWEVIPEKVNGQARMEAVPLKKSYGEGGLNLHAKNHLECIKSRNRNCNASVEIGAHIAKFSQLGNIAYRTGKKLSWDGKSFHDTEADKLLCKEYRAPWELPKI